MTRHRSMKQAGVAVAVAVALCVMSSPSGATAIWGGGRRVALASSSSEPGRAGWRASDGSRAGWRVSEDSRAGWRLSEGSRAGWRLYTLFQTLRAGW